MSEADELALIEAALDAVLSELRATDTTPRALAISPALKPRLKEIGNERIQ